MKYISEVRVKMKNIVCFHFRFHTTTPETSDSELRPSFRRSSVPVEGLGPPTGWCSQPTEGGISQTLGRLPPPSHTRQQPHPAHTSAPRWSTPSQSSSRGLARRTCFAFSDNTVSVRRTCFAFSDITVSVRLLTRRIPKAKQDSLVNT